MWDDASLIFKMAVLGYICASTRIALDRLRQRRWLILGNAMKLHYGLKFGGMMQCTMKLSQCSRFLISAGRGCCRSPNVLLITFLVVVDLCDNKRMTNRCIILTHICHAISIERDNLQIKYLPINDNTSMKTGRIFIWPMTPPVAAFTYMV